MIKKHKNNFEVCEGCFDTHIHGSPDIVQRKMNDIELAIQAKKANMAGILLKNHFEPTTSRAWLVQNFVGKETKVFGGCVLNNTVGGLNPEMVEIQIKLGAKEIWMPTMHAKNHIDKMYKNSAKNNDYYKNGISIIDEDNQKLKPEVFPILELIAINNIILGTGHLSANEIVLLVKEAQKIGVKKILITHPEWWVVNLPINLQVELAYKEGIYFERCLYFLTESDERDVNFTVILDEINKVGVNSTVIATDFGQKDNPEPVSGLIDYITRLKNAGYCQKDLNIMSKENPSFLLGIN